MSKKTKKKVIVVSSSKKKIAPTVSKTKSFSCFSSGFIKRSTALWKTALYSDGCRNWPDVYRLSFNAGWYICLIPTPGTLTLFTVFAGPSLLPIFILGWLNC